MHWLRTSPILTRLVLAWFLWVLGVAGISPIVHPKTMEVVCSTGSSVKVIFTDDGQPAQTDQHSLDCSMCLLAAAPPPVAIADMPAPAPLALALAPIIAAHVTALVGAPLPARGPPSLA